MAASDTFHVSVVTPERAVLEADATFVALPAHDGELGVMRRRAPFLYRLDVGRLRVETPEENHLFYIDGGFAEMVGDRLTVLTEVARRPDELDRESAEATLAAAREMKVSDDESFERRQRALKRGRVQLRLLS